MDENPALSAQLDQVSAAVRDMREDAPVARAETRCVIAPAGCGQVIRTGFRDAASQAEYAITGLCQSCQDFHFGSDDEDEWEECYACMVGVWTGPESHHPSCSSRNRPRSQSTA